MPEIYKPSVTLPSGEVVGEVTKVEESEEGVIAHIRLNEDFTPLMMERMLRNFFSIDGDSLDHKVINITPEGPEPQIVHIVKSVKQHVAVCNGEPYSGSTGTGPVKLCPECYNKTFKGHNHKAVQHRDAKEPWCNECGLTQDGREPKSIFRKGGD